MKKNGSLTVMSKKKKKKPRNKATARKKETKEQKEKRLKAEKEYTKRLGEQDPEFKEKVWQKNFSKIASLIQNETELQIENDNLMPFDFVATSDQEFDSQKDVVIEKIQNLLSSDKPDDSLALFREARFLFSNDRELFGSHQIQADEEFEVYKNLFMRPIEISKPIVEEKQSEPEPVEKETNEGDDLFNEENDECNEYEKEDEVDDEKYEIEEENLDVEKFLFRYTNPHILKCYILMLSEYAKNSDFLNRCCMSMFEKIAYDCNALQCLYQLSLFNLINTMHKDPMSRCMLNILDNNTQKRSIDDLYASNYSVEDMFAFFRQLVGKFFEQAKKNDKLFLEILFFKEKKTVFYLGEENGYEQMFAEPTNGKTKKVAWTQEERDELKELFDRFKPRFGKKDSEENQNESFNEVEQEMNGDLVDLIMLHINDGSRKRRDICNMLVNIGCVKSMDELKLEKYTNGNKKLGRNGIWRSEDLDDLKQCYELIKSEEAQTNSILKENIMHRLQDIMTIKRNKKAIAEKMAEIGLIKDKNEILKKSKSIKSARNSDSENEIVIDKQKKSKKSKKSKQKGEGNDLFDAESGDSSANSDSDEDSSSSSSSSESEKENEQKEKPSHKQNIILTSDDEENLTAKRKDSQNNIETNEINKEKDSDSKVETSKENSESKKRKKKTKYRIIDDESSSNSYDAFVLQKKDKALSEISNSELIESEQDKPVGKIVRINYKDLYKQVMNDAKNDEESSEDSDDELPLSDLVSKSKRQKLILSDDE